MDVEKKVAGRAREGVTPPRARTSAHNKPVRLPSQHNERTHTHTHTRDAHILYNVRVTRFTPGSTQRVFVQSCRDAQRQKHRQHTRTHTHRPTRSRHWYWERQPNRRPNTSMFNAFTKWRKQTLVEVEQFPHSGNKSRRQRARGCFSAPMMLMNILTSIITGRGPSAPCQRRRGGVLLICSPRFRINTCRVPPRSSNL